MPREQLKEALDALHEELEAGGELAEEDRAALLKAADEIRATLASDATPSAEDAPLSGRVSAMIEEFEATHPKFAEILSNVSEALANLGI